MKKSTKNRPKKVKARDSIYTHLLSLPPSIFFYLHLQLHYTTPPTMANVLKRSALKLGMIPADGIGKEVLPVRSSSAPLIASSLMNKQMAHKKYIYI